jgi:hypothetical protein
LEYPSSELSKLTVRMGLPIAGTAKKMIVIIIENTIDNIDGSI